MKPKKQIPAANTVLGVGMIIRNSGKSEFIWKRLACAMHKVWLKDLTDEEKAEWERRLSSFGTKSYKVNKGDILYFGEIGYDKDEREMFSRLYDFQLDYERICKVPLIDFVPNFEKRWVDLNTGLDYGDDGWVIEEERERQRKNAKRIDGATFDNTLGYCMPSSCYLKFR